MYKFYCIDLKIKCLMFLIQLFQIESIHINPKGPTVINETTHCLYNLIQDYFDFTGTVAFSNIFNFPNITSTVASIQGELIPMVHSTMKWSVYIVDSDLSKYIENSIDDMDNEETKIKVEKFTSISPVNYVVVVVDAFTKFKSIIMKFSSLRIWNPRAKFLIVCIRNYQAGEVESRDPEKILTYLFNLYVMKAIVVVASMDSVRILKIFSWKPYEPPKYCGYKNETAQGRVNIVGTCHNGILQHNGHFINFDPVPNNFHGCSIKVLALKRRPHVKENGEGIEELLLNDVARHLHISLSVKIQNIPRGERNLLGEWEDGLGILKSGKVDLLFGGLYPDNEVNEDFEGSELYLTDTYAWAVPKAKLLPAYTSLVRTFHIYIWYSIIFCYFVTVVSWFLIAHGSGDSKYHKTLSHCALNTLYTIVSGSAYMRPKSQSLKIFFIFMTIYSIIIFTSYQMKLIAVLTNPAFHHQIANLEELVSSDLAWGGFSELYDLYENSSDTNEQLIFDRYLINDNITDSLLNVVIHRNYSVIISRLELLDMTSTETFLSDNLGGRKYFVFTENIFSVRAQFICLKGFPLIQKFNEKINYYKQQGIIKKISDEFSVSVAWKISKLHTENIIDDGHTPLSLDHLQGGFLILAIGYTTGLVVLALEMFINTKIYKKYRNQLMKIKLRKINPRK